MQPTDTPSNQPENSGIPNPGMLQAAAQQPAVLQQAATATPEIADDADMIEVEWVAALQRTIEHYKHDPYALSKALTALRHDYLQKRYGKTIEAAK